MIGIRGGKYPIVDLHDYDLIYAGGPIWMGGPAPGFIRLLNNLDVRGKKIKFFFRAGGGDASRLDKILDKKSKEWELDVLKTIIINGEDTQEASEAKLKDLIAE